MHPLAQTFIYIIGGMLSRLSAIFLIPLFTHTLSIDEYGRLELTLALQSVMVLIGGLQVESAWAREYFESIKKNQLHQLSQSALILTALGCLAVFFILLLAIIFDITERWIPNDLIFWAGLTILPAQFSGLQFVVLRFKGYAALYAILSFFDLVATAGFSWVFIIINNAGPVGAFQGIFSAKIIVCLIAWFYTFHGSICWIPWAQLRLWMLKLLKYGVPSLPAVIINWVHGAGNKVLLGLMLTLQDVAIAGFALKVASIFGFVVYAIRLSWEPHSINRLDYHLQDKTYFRHALEWYALGLLTLMIAILMIIPWIVSILAPQIYSDALIPAIPMILGYYWIGITHITVIGIQGSRQIHKMLPVYAWGSIVNVAIVVVTAQFFGSLAVSFGFLFGSVVSGFLAASASNQLFDTTFDRHFLISVFLCSLFLSSVIILFLYFFGNPASGSQDLGTEIIIWLMMVIFTGAFVLSLMINFGLKPHRRKQMVSDLADHYRKLRIGLKM